MNEQLNITICYKIKEWVYTLGVENSCYKTKRRRKKKKAIESGDCGCGFWSHGEKYIN